MFSIKGIIGMGLNVVTCGGWRAIKWVYRRFKGDGSNQTFLSRVATLVVGHFVISALTGAISPWGVLMMLGRSIVYLSLAVIHLAGGRGELPPTEDAKAQTALAKAKAAVSGGIVKAKDAMDDRVEKMKAAMEERKQKMEEEFARRKKELEERDWAEQLTKRKRDAEEEIAKRRSSVEEEVARRKADMEAKEQELLAKAKAEIKEHTPSPWGMIFGSSEKDSDTISITCPQCNRILKYPIAKANDCVSCGYCRRGLARKGIVNTLKFPALKKGQVVNVACSECAEEGLVTGDGVCTVFRCRCKRTWYILDGIEHYEVRQIDKKICKEWFEEQERKKSSNAPAPAPAPAAAPAAAP